jgi:hypothetical protein
MIYGVLPRVDPGRAPTNARTISTERLIVVDCKTKKGIDHVKTKYWEDTIVGQREK